MLYHHCNRAYDVAASEAAEDAKVKMKRLIATGRQSGQAMIQHVMSKVPQDAIVKAKAMNFEGAAGGLAVKAGDERWTLHGHALRQLAERAGVPAKYLADLSTSQDVWQRDLAAHTPGPPRARIAAAMDDGSPPPPPSASSSRCGNGSRAPG